tara:strand:- start:7787 stop:7948 length:162 start_codon:yes stop_codon:yes gene_type:complete
MDEKEDIDALHAKHLIQTFVILYDKWEARPPESQTDLKQLMKTFRQNCDNYGF